MFLVFFSFVLTSTGLYMDLLFQNTWGFHCFGFDPFISKFPYRVVRVHAGFQASDSEKFSVFQ